MASDLAASFAPPAPVSVEGGAGAKRDPAGEKADALACLDQIVAGRWRLSRVKMQLTWASINLAAAHPPASKASLSLAPPSRVRCRASAIWAQCQRAAAGGFLPPSSIAAFAQELLHLYPDQRFLYPDQRFVLYEQYRLGRTRMLGRIIVRHFGAGPRHSNTSKYKRVRVLSVPKNATLATPFREVH